ncbi:MAG: NAD(+)/NADH kinase [Verrucomicrobiota bacterium]
MDTPRVAIVANVDKPGAAKVVVDLLEQFAGLGVETFLEKATAEFCGHQGGTTLEALADQADLFVLLGGDGTLLQLANTLGPKVKPLAAINTGTLGFLTLGTVEDLPEITRLIASRSYELSQRSVITVTTIEPDENPGIRYALNEVSISRGAATRAVKVEARVGGEFLTTYSGDGLIVSTPTGSTAYSLSAGGPIIEPNSGVFVLTPVCPHSLSSRPLVVSNQSPIEITTPEQRDEVVMTVDGQKAHLMNGETKLVIGVADYSVPLVTSRKGSFFGVLRQKLDWSGSNT